MNPLDRFFFRPMLFVGLGGFGCELLLLLRALLFQRLGWVPECVRWLALDFASDPPRPPAAEFPQTPGAVWDAVALRPAERALIALGSDIPALADRIRERDPETAWIADMIPLAILEGYSGGEASQIPALTRAALAFCAEQPERAGEGQTASWLDLLEGALRDLEPGGRAMHQFVTARRGLTAQTDGRNPVAVLVAGAGGGTGTGALLPLAIATRALAAELGLRLKSHAMMISGHYRPADGMEPRKLALSHVLEADIEYAMGRVSFAVRTGADSKIEARGPLFDAVYRQEAGGRMAHDPRQVLSAAAETLLFRCFSAAGREMERSRNNARMIPAIRALSSEKSWGPRRSGKRI